MNVSSISVNNVSTPHDKRKHDSTFSQDKFLKIIFPLNINKDTSSNF